MNLFATRTSPHIGGSNDVTLLMGQVLLALVPGIAALTWYFGPGVLVNLALATVTCVVAEWLFIKARGRDPRPAILDLSAVVTAVLLALALPPLLPWWVTVSGALFAIILVKQLYGGLGYNPFNPAMAGYVFLLISFPSEMTRWVQPYMINSNQLGLVETLHLVFTGHFPAGLGWDAVTGATPLDEMRTRLDMNQMIHEIRESPLWGDFGGRGWEWVGNWFLLGGLFLLWRRVISWHIPVAMLGSLALVSGLAWLADPDTHAHPAFHLFSGGAMLGAFFIATDPVSAATTRKGQLIYGALIGALVFVIRSWGGYPDAVAFAVLLMNMAAPTIDYYTQPRVFGRDLDKHEQGPDS